MNKNLFTAAVPRAARTAAPRKGTHLNTANGGPAGAFRGGGVFGGGGVKSLEAPPGQPCADYRAPRPSRRRRN